MQLTLPKLPFNILITSRQLISGLHINNLGGLLTSFIGSITATPNGTAANSLILDAAFIEITAVTTGNDSVTLPPAKVGLRVCITNSDGANTATIFANGTDTINAASASVTLAAAATAMFVCTKNGIWKRFISA